MVNHEDRIRLDNKKDSVLKFNLSGNETLEELKKMMSDGIYGDITANNDVIDSPGVSSIGSPVNKGELDKILSAVGVASANGDSHNLILDDPNFSLKVGAYVRVKTIIEITPPFTLNVNNTGAYNVLSSNKGEYSGISKDVWCDFCFNGESYILQARSNELRINYDIKRSKYYQDTPQTLYENLDKSVWRPYGVADGDGNVWYSGNLNRVPGAYYYPIMMIDKSGTMSIKQPIPYVDNEEYVGETLLRYDYIDLSGQCIRYKNDVIFIYSSLRIGRFPKYSIGGYIYNKNGKAGFYSGWYDFVVPIYVMDACRITMLSVGNDDEWNLIVAGGLLDPPYSNGSTTTSQLNCAVKSTPGPYSNREITLPALSTPKYGMRSICDGKGNVWFFKDGDTTIEVYTKTNTKFLSSSQINRTNAGLARDIDGNIIYIGGDGTSGNPDQGITNMEMFTPDNKRSMRGSYVYSGFVHTSKGAKNSIGFNKYGNLIIVLPQAQTFSERQYVFDYWEMTRDNKSPNVCIPYTLHSGPYYDYVSNGNIAEDGDGNFLLSYITESTLSTNYMEIVKIFAKPYMKIYLPIGSRYKFEEHKNEQVLSREDFIYVKTPNKGYAIIGGVSRLL